MTRHLFRRFAMVSLLAMLCVGAGGRRSAPSLLASGCAPLAEITGNDSPDPTAENTNAASDPNTELAEGAGDNANTSLNENGSVSDPNQADPNDPDASANSNENVNQNGSADPADIAGAFAGPLTLTSVQTVEGNESTPILQNITQDAEFAADGLPTGLAILGFASAPTVVIAGTEVGYVEDVVRTVSLGSTRLNLELRYTILEASYTPTTMRAVVRIRYRGVGGVLVQTGTGTQTIDAAVGAGGALTYTTNVEYDVQQSVGSLVLNTREVKGGAADLARVP